MRQPTTGDQKFFGLLGLYLVHWSSFELALDIALWKFSGGSPELSLRGHCKSTAKEKVSEVQGLVANSDHPHKDELHNILERVPSESVRNLISHGMMSFGQDVFSARMINRSGKLISHEFSYASMVEHLKEMSDLAFKFETLMDHGEQDATAIWNAYALISET